MGHFLTNSCVSIRWRQLSGHPSLHACGMHSCDQRTPSSGVTNDQSGESFSFITGVKATWNIGSVCYYFVIMRGLNMWIASLEYGQSGVGLEHLTEQGLKHSIFSPCSNSLCIRGWQVLLRWSSVSLTVKREFASLLCFQSVANGSQVVHR